MNPTQRPCLKSHKNPVPDKCHACWLWLNNPTYRRLWGGKKLKSRQRTYQGKTVPCEGCKGNVRIKVRPKGIQWSYGITTVPSRITTLLANTVDSLKRAGFTNPRLFLDGGSIDDCKAIKERFNLPITWRDVSLNLAGNWVASMIELYYTDPWADRYVIFQDDIVACKNLRAYLDSQPFPDKAYLNLFTFLENEDTIRGKEVGWVEGTHLTSGLKLAGLPAQKGRGAIALVFSRDSILTLLTSREFYDRAQNSDRGYRIIDGAIVHILNKAGYREYIHNPSLVQHTGWTSALTGGRRPSTWSANSFRGEEFDAITCIQNKSDAKV